MRKSWWMRIVNDVGAGDKLPAAAGHDISGTGLLRDVVEFDAAVDLGGGARDAGCRVVGDAVGRAAASSPGHATPPNSVTLPDLRLTVAMTGGGPPAAP